MEFFLKMFLPVVLYIVAIVLIVVLICVGIKLLKILDKVDRIADNIDEKVNTFNGALAVLKNASDGIASISDTFVFAATSFISKLFGKVRKNKEEEEYE